MDEMQYGRPVSGLPFLQLREESVPAGKAVAPAKKDSYSEIPGMLFRNRRSAGFRFSRCHPAITVINVSSPSMGTAITFSRVIRLSVM